MNLKTYRAKSLQQALLLIRRDLGPEASVLHTREVTGGLRGLLGGRHVEVTASVGVPVPSRFSNSAPAVAAPTVYLDSEGIAVPPPPAHADYREKFRHDLKDQLDGLQSMVEELCQRSEKSPHRDQPEALSRLQAELLDADVGEELARELVERVRLRAAPEDLRDAAMLRVRLARLLEEEIVCRGPIRLNARQQSLVALVGPTGVGKTTTIAKLAALFHLREKRRVGLITVDTYRIAAVDQLQTYADIIDLPMEVVSTPREMRAALARLAEMDLILMDTAGRNPGDEVRIQELKSLLAEAHADEVHLVLSSVASPSSLRQAAERFLPVGVTALVLTKLDEATSIGNLLSVLRGGRLPLSYVTTGQNVPDDIAPADPRQLAQRVFRMEEGR